MRAEDKTIFLVVNLGFGARYLLRTDILKTLKASGARIVILSPNADEMYFRQEFEDKNVFVEKLEAEKCAAYRNRSRAQLFLRTVRLHTLSGAHEISTIRDHRRLFRQPFPVKGWKGKLYLAGASLLMEVLSRSRWLRQLLIRVESRLYCGRIHRHLFEKYRPDLLVITSLGYWHPDEYLMREAKAHGALVVPVILSWDNTSGKGMAGAQADYVVAWTHAMKDELVVYHDFAPQRVFVGGVAHFDLYYHPDQLMSREELLARMGLMPDRKLILFATKSPNNYPWNPDIVELLAKAMEAGRFVKPCQLVVRLHPIHFRYKDGQLIFQQVLDEYERLRTRYPFVHFDTPQVLSKRLSLDTPWSDMVRLGSLLQHADVLVNIFSTMALEASIFDLPTIHVAFEGDPRRKTKPRHSIKIDEVQVHNQRVVQTGGVRVAHTPEELIEHINSYLTDGSHDASGRLQIKEQECGPFPGSVGRTVAEYLLSLLPAEEGVQ